MSTAPVKVLYIVGWSRSGSTLLASILNELDGFFSAGEVTFLWKRGLVEQRSCGCGRPVPECPLWGDVLERARPELPDPSLVVEWERSAARTRHVPGLLARQARSGSPALRGYASALAAVYRAVRDVTGAELIVDSSKRPSTAAVVRNLPGVQAYFLHLVRDPRAVAWSYRRKKANRGASPTPYMSRRRPASSTLQWMVWNLSAEALRRRVGDGRVLRLRYEDMMADPQGAIRHVLGFVDTDSDAWPFVDAWTVRLGQNHTVAGNPNRFEGGTVRIQADDEWRRAQPRADRLVATALASPLLGLYGYGVRDGGTRHSRGRLASRAVVGARFLRAAVRHPREAAERVRTKGEIRAAQTIARRRSYTPDEDWARLLHEQLGAPWPCEHTGFQEVWEEITAEFGQELYRQDTPHDADLNLASIVWCCVRQLLPQRVVETGVARGVTSRFILEALERNGSGHLWSVDLPPLSDPWHSLTASAVPDRLRHRWRYLRGGSRSVLPGLLRDLGTIDVFVHDSLHTPQTMAFEFSEAWPRLVEGGVLVSDDIQGNDAFADAAAAAGGGAITAGHAHKDEMVGVLVKGPARQRP